MDLREYREHQMNAIEQAKAEIEAIKAYDIRFYERSDSRPSEVEVTDKVMDQKLKYIQTLHKIIEMLDREINGK